MARSLTSFFSLVRNYFSRLQAWLGKILSRAWRYSIGSLRVQWEKPQWMNAAAAKWRTSRAGIWTRLHPKRALISVAGALIAALVFGVAGHSWWVNRPVPTYVDVTIEVPPPTDPLKKEVQPLRLRFSQSVANLKDLNRRITAGVSLSPAVPGEWRWNSDSVLVFTPTLASAQPFDWPAGTEYTVRFSRGFFPGHLSFERREWEFTTAPFGLEFLASDFYIDPRQPSVKKVVATLASNYPMDPESLKKRVHFDYRSADASVLKRPASEVSWSVSFNPTSTVAYFESAHLELPREDYEMQVRVETGVAPRNGGRGSETEVRRAVSVRGQFTALKIERAEVVFARNEKFEPEQVLVVETTTDARSEDVQKALEVLLLPANHRPVGAKKDIPLYSWSSPGELTPEVRKKSVPVELRLNPTEKPYGRIHSFRVTAPVVRSLYLKVGKGLVGLGGYELAATYEQVIRVPDFQPELLFMTQGSILSLSGDKKVPLLARNVRAVTFEIGRIIPAQTNHLIERIANGEGFAKPYYFEGIGEKITERFEVKMNLQPKSPSDTTYFSLDLDPYVKDQRGFFYVRVHSDLNPDERERGMQRLDATRLILVTDLGIIAKRAASESVDLFVQDFRSGQPVAGASVEVLGQNGLSVLQLATGTDGKAEIPPLKDYVRERAPLAYVVRRGSDISYLPATAGDRQLSLSRFDVGGVQESSDSDELTAMLFSDRGIYRPGEKVDLGLILRGKRFDPRQGELPLRWTVTDPRGNTVKDERIRSRAFALHDLTFSTASTSPTGAYEVSVAFVRKRGDREELDRLGSLTVTVEEFVPDQMKIQANLTPTRIVGWIPAERIKADVSVRTLFGSAAENRRISARYTLVPTVPVVKAFRDYQFSNPNRADARTQVELLTDLKSNDRGEASFDIDLKKFEGYFSLRFEVEGFQAEGGRSVRAIASTAVSSLPRLVGYRADGNLRFIHRGAGRHIQWIAVDPSHQAVTVEDLRLTLLERKFVSALLRQDDGTYRYQSVRKESVIRETRFAVPKKGAAFDLPTDRPGDFVYVVSDAAHRELNRLEYSVVGEANLSRSLDRTAELELVLNKSDYKPGEEIEVQIRAPYVGAGLITIERDSVYTHKWFQASTENTVEKIRIPEGLQGNAYVSVTFLRAMTSREIYMSPLSYGVQPFSISLDEHRTQVKLEVPEKVKPGDQLSIRYRTDRPTKLILYGVDEGILQVARYRLPDPLQFFFRKKSLQVRTTQLLDLLLPDFNVVQQLASAPGGDEGANALGRNLNPFRRKGQPAVAFWSGVLNADTGMKTFAWKVPETFNGNVKIMAVASSERGLGSSEVGVISKGDFVVSPSAPLFVAPDDQFRVSVSVSNQVEGAQAPKDLKVELAATDGFAVVGPASHALTVEPGHEATLDFLLKARQKPGNAEMAVRVTGGKFQARSSTAVSIRPALPYQTTVALSRVDRDDVSFDLRRRRIPEYRENHFVVSPLPIAYGKGVADFLGDFPYGCTEQILSKAVPSLVFRGKPELVPAPEKQREFHATVLATLRERLTSDGGYGLYTGKEASHTGASLHAIRYLIEAKAAGLSVPEDLLARALPYLQDPALRKSANLTDLRNFAEAIYLQARLSYVPAADLNFIREVLAKNFKGKWDKDPIAIHLAGTYALLEQRDAGDALVRNLRFGEFTEVDTDHWLDPTVRDAQLLQIVAAHFPARLGTLTGADSLAKLFAPLQRGEFNTYSAAQIIYGLGALLSQANSAGGLSGIRFEEIVNGMARPLTLGTAKGIVGRVDPSGDATQIRLHGARRDVPLYASLTEKGFDADLPRKEIQSGVEIAREFLAADGEPMKKVKIGDEMTVSLRLRSLKKPFDHLAIVDLFPAGFELIPESRANESSASEEGAGEGESAETHEESEEGAEGEEGGESAEHSLFRSAYAADGLSRLNPSFVDYREDRVVIYTRAATTVGEFRYRLKAVSRGTFVVPPIFGQALYDSSVLARGKMGSITIE